MNNQGINNKDMADIVWRLAVEGARAGAHELFREIHNPKLFRDIRTWYFGVWSQIFVCGSGMKTYTTSFRGTARNVRGWKIVF